MKLLVLTVAALKISRYRTREAGRFLMRAGPS